MSGTVVLDISRLLSRADRATPTGIDRVELAYARHLIDTEGRRLRFAALDLRGRIALLPTGASMRFVERTEQVWAAGDGRDGDRRLQRTGVALGAASLAGRGGAALRTAPGEPRPSYLLLSHHHLDRPRVVRRFLQASGARFVTLVHDLIPIELPEYNRTGHDAKHAVRMTTAAELSDVVIVNSDGTGAALAPFLARAGRAPPVVTAHLGVHDLALSAPVRRPQAGAPYFVIVSTIEPRKNHLLLFNVWRRLAAELGSATPHLHVVGHRGWHNEAVFDVLDRSASLRPHLTEHADLSDAAVAKLLVGARAVLMPSFAEGYGLPVAEALSVGAPVVCSDLPTLRDVGGAAPEYLDPLDGPAWGAAVRDYADAASPRRRAQVARIAGWRAPTWARHFALVDAHLRDPG